MNSLTIKEIKPDLRYIVLRTSLATYETPPYELSSDKLGKILKQAQNEHQIQGKILASKEALDVILSEESIERACKEVSSRYENENDFHDDLAKNNLDESQFRKSLTRELKVETILERVTSRSVPVSEIDVMIYYHMHQEKMRKPEVRVARHILVTINEEMPENTRENAEQKINQILEKLKKKPKKFSELAMKYSECPTAFKGGLLGNVTKGVLYPELEEILFKMKVNQVSPVVESELGFHILYCDEIQKEKNLSIADATPAIKEVLEKRRKKICQQTWLSKILAGDKNE